MADVEWAILCDYAFLDAARKHCLIGIFSRLFTPAVPAVHHQAALVIKVSGNPNEEIKFKVQINRPIEHGGTTIATFGGSAKCGEDGTVEVSSNIANMPLPDFGDYSFNIYIEENMVKAVPFTVMRPPVQPPQQSK